MKIPLPPPDYEKGMRELLQDSAITKIFLEAQRDTQATTDKGEYLH